MQIQTPLKPLSESQYNDVRQLNQEYKIGFEILNQIKNPKVTFYGSHKLQKIDPLYKQIHSIAATFAKNNWTVVSGGGPGVMRASLEGARSEGGQTIAFKLDITNEPSDFIPDFEYTFEHFATRKYALRQSEIYIYCPGSFGTIDELMDNLILLETDKLAKRKVFLLGTEFWKGLDSWISSEIIKKHHFDVTSTLELYQIVDTEREIFDEVFGTSKI
jgi:uncharacterized protein (TIGR00730 family)